MDMLVFSCTLGYVYSGILRHRCILILIGFSVYIDTEAGEVEVGAIPAALMVIVAVIGTVAAAAAVVLV